jgi:hypothetical protein
MYNLMNAERNEELIARQEAFIKRIRETPKKGFPATGSVIDISRRFGRHPLFDAFKEAAQAQIAAADELFDFAEFIKAGHGLTESDVAKYVKVTDAEYEAGVAAQTAIENLFDAL